MDIRIPVVLPGRDDEEGGLRLCSQGTSGEYSVVFTSEKSYNETLPLSALKRNKEFEKNEFLLLLYKEIVVLRAVRDVDYKQFSEALHLVQEIVNMKLHLNMCIREVFVDGIHAEEESCQAITIPKNLHEMLKKTSSTVLKEFMNDDNINNKESNESNLLSPKEMKKKKDKKLKINELNFSVFSCVYCDFPGDLKQPNIRVHPYVPVTMDRKVLYLCETCIKNWFTFRKQATELKLLVLPGEYNEEICCICSDSPSELVLCSSCPRSYCLPCLNKILTQKQNQDMSTDENWKCLCCVHSDQLFKEFAKSLNLTISSSKCNLLLNSLDIEPTSAKPSPPSTVSIVEKSDNHSTENNTQCTDQNDINKDEDKPLGIGKRQRRPPAKFEEVEGLSLSPKKRRRDSSSSADNVKNINFKEEYGNHSGTKSKRMRRNDYESTNGKCSEENDKTYESQFSGHVLNESIAKDVEICDDSPHDNRVALPPVNTDLDECYYFSQYVDSLRYDNGFAEHSEHVEGASEDFCFLCKDGGELIECDHGKSTTACRKVYHDYCIGYEIPDDLETWICLRHYCACCGAEAVEYQCHYCPISCCRKCFHAWNVKNKYKEYAEISHGSYVSVHKSRKAKRKAQRKKTSNPVSSHVVNVVCGSCLVMFDKCYAKGQLNKSDFDSRALRKVSGLIKRSSHVTEEASSVCVDITNEDVSSSKEDMPIDGESSTCINNDNNQVDVVEELPTDEALVSQVQTPSLHDKGNLKDDVDNEASSVIDKAATTTDDINECCIDDRVASDNEGEKSSKCTPSSNSGSADNRSDNMDTEAKVDVNADRMSTLL